MFKLKDLSLMLKTGDLQASIDFYTEILGFQVCTLWPEQNPTFCILDHGDVRVMFYVDENQCDPEPVLTGHLYIDADDVQDLYERIKDQVEIVWGPEVYHYGRREFAIKDCNGYVLAFSESTNEPPTCPAE
ncbi:hypothetical protein GWO43_28405 [candidate division KSB1 bacterium]|nr:hypothetical protein [candidate division KSB1 bacterium]NIR70817.1 hypothetical protein [candidate division KSB1 bacterium]NIS27829.1 hypothetical protein [candidate division KSB1 bacterium]NIT74711.1 hypothetical protein [candidate division KSB1 bacterium]NIU28494.1 hypothetical protein [candidate division KSB1 bacterium]